LALELAVGDGDERAFRVRRKPPLDDIGRGLAPGEDDAPLGLEGGDDDVVADPVHVPLPAHARAGLELAARSREPEIGGLLWIDEGVEQLRDRSAYEHLRFDDGRGHLGHSGGFMLMVRAFPVSSMLFSDERIAPQPVWPALMYLRGMALS